MTETRTALVTGSAGFIGYHVAKRLLADGFRVVGFDGMTDYYDVTLKQRRHAILLQTPGFTATEAMLEDEGRLAALIAETRPDIVIHLAAQAGVRYSLEAPRTYVEANLVGTFNLLEALRETPCAHLLFASTSSVYGANPQMPFAETDRADHQLSFYAATKKAGEAMAHAYAHLHGQPTTCFRFFTVYGPWGRPDMALFRFTKAILEGRPIEVYNRGEMSRDFTYIDDLAEAVRRLVDVTPNRPETPEAIAEGDSLSPAAPFRVVNIGNAAPVPLMELISALEAALGREAEKTYLPMQPGDVAATWADTGLLERLTGFRPASELGEGVRAFVDWYREYYGV